MLGAISQRLTGATLAEELLTAIGDEALLRRAENARSLQAGAAVHRGELPSRNDPVAAGRAGTVQRGPRLPRRWEFPWHGHDAPTG